MDNPPDFIHLFFSSILKDFKDGLWLHLVQLLRLFRALQTSRVLNISTYERWRMN